MSLETRLRLALLAAGVAGLVLILAWAFTAGRRDAAPAIEAATDQAVSSRLEAEGAAASAARLEAFHRQSLATLEALGAVQAAALQAEDADAPLDPDRTARLRAHDRQLCGAAGFNGCARPPD